MPLTLQPPRAIPNTLKVSSPSIRGRLEIAWIDHWIKNVFVFPGIAGKTIHSVMGHIVKPAGEQSKLASL
jgi:hypothetical protein